MPRLTLREKNFKKWLDGRMAAWWVSQWHEDKFSNDIADLSFCVENRLGTTEVQSMQTGGAHGWLEFKTLKAHPKSGGPLKFPKFTAGQQEWLEARNKVGGNCFMIFNIESTQEIFLVKPRNFENIGIWGIDQYRAYCPKWTFSNFNPRSFAETISGVPNPTQLLKIIS